jgi:V/A-type H+-transporting ATPase subunit D
MPEVVAGLSANRSAALELRDERRLVREGYELLDEKRVLLATEILRRLAAYRARREDWLRGWRVARAALAASLAAHGVEGVQLQPAAPQALRLEVAIRRIAGVALATVEPREEPAPVPSGPAAVPVWPSAALEACRAAFRPLVALTALLAADERNLRRLAREYVRTDRRARALENVLLPELDDALSFVEEQLEYMDAEEAVRVHEAQRRIDGAGG